MYDGLQEKIMYKLNKQILSLTHVFCRLRLMHKHTHTHQGHNGRGSICHPELKKNMYISLMKFDDNMHMHVIEIFICSLQSFSPLPPLENSEMTHYEI